jgi:hypothetical protein
MYPVCDGVKLDGNKCTNHALNKVVYGKVCKHSCNHRNHLNHVIDMVEKDFSKVYRKTHINQKDWIADDGTTHSDDRYQTHSTTYSYTSFTNESQTNCKTDLLQKISKLKEENSILQAKIAELVHSSSSNSPDETFQKIQDSVQTIVQRINNSVSQDEKKLMLRQLQLQVHPDKNPLELRWLFDEIFKMI